MSLSSPDLRAAFASLVGEGCEFVPVFLEQHFPHVLTRVIQLWDSPQIGPYLDALLTPPGPTRTGFPTAALDEIFRIARLREAAPAPVQAADVTQTDRGQGRDERGDLLNHVRFLRSGLKF